MFLVLKFAISENRIKSISLSLAESSSTWFHAITADDFFFYLRRLFGLRVVVFSGMLLPRRTRSLWFLFNPNWFWKIGLETNIWDYRLQQMFCFVALSHYVHCARVCYYLFLSMRASCEFEKKSKLQVVNKVAKIKMNIFRPKWSIHENQSGVEYKSENEGTAA